MISETRRLFTRSGFLCSVFLLIASLSSCEDGQVVVFTATDASAAGGGPGSPPDSGSDGTTCASSADCSPSWFCEKSDCADALGSCVPLHLLLCDESPAPVCGCDHVTYWNDCLRQQSGVSASTSGECGPGARSCNVSSDCPGSGASCAHLLPPQANCGPSGPGNCWVTPNVCSSGSDPRRWMPCLPQMMGGGQMPCLDTCAAIQSGRPYQPLPPGGTCF